MDLMIVMGHSPCGNHPSPHGAPGLGFFGGPALDGSQMARIEGMRKVSD